MRATLDKIADELMILPPSDRLELAEALILRTPDFADAATEKAWSDEVQQRAEDLKAGRENLIPAKDSFAAARKALRETRPSSLHRPS